MDEESPTNPILERCDDDEENVSCADVGCCNPQNRCHRFIALIFMCLMGFGKCNSVFCNTKVLVSKVIND